MEEVKDAVGLIKSFLIEKNLDEWWVNEMQEQIKEVRSQQKQVKSALRESREDSEVVTLQKDIMKGIKMLEYSLGKSHYIDAQLDQTTEVLSSLIEKRLEEIKDSEYRDEEDDIFEDDEIERFFSVVKRTKEDTFNLWEKIGPFYYGPRPKEFKRGTSRTSFFIEENGGEILYYGEIRERDDEDEDAEPVREGKGVMFHIGTGRLTEGWFKDDAPWGYRRQINGNL